MAAVVVVGGAGAGRAALEREGVRGRVARHFVWRWTRVWEWRCGCGDAMRTAEETRRAEKLWLWS
jgi:hypothetical protein